MAEEQLGFDGERFAVKQDYWMFRGDTKELVFQHDLGAAAAVKAAQIELELEGDPYTTILSLTKADHSTQWDFTTDDEGTITFAALDSASLTPGSYRYDVQLTDQSDRVYTALYGTFQLNRDAVDNSGTSPYPNWTTLDDLEADIAGMATCANVSWLTVAATGGAMATLDVENGAIFKAADDIRLELTDGTYEDDIVASMDVNEITLTATIAGEAAIGAVVRIL